MYQPVHYFKFLKNIELREIFFSMLRIYVHILLYHIFFLFELVVY
jgi:hypothetical protein